MSPEKLGSLIGASFGLVFVWANAGALPGHVPLTLRLVAALALLGVLAAVSRPSRPRLPGPPGSGLGRSFWLVVAAEAVAIVGGSALLRGPLNAPQAAVAWVALVVGLHFLALAILWKEVVFRWLGAGLSASGAIGLALAAGGSGAAPVHLAGGVLPGAMLLGFGLWGSRRGAPRPESKPAPTPADGP